MADHGSGLTTAGHLGREGGNTNIDDYRLTGNLANFTEDLPN